MVKIELGKVYIDRAGVVVCVYSHDPTTYSTSYEYRNFSYGAMCLSFDTSFVSFYSTYNTKGQFNKKPGLRDVVREATLEELEAALIKHKTVLSNPNNSKIVSKFHEEWKKHNPL